MKYLIKHSLLLFMLLIPSWVLAKDNLDQHRPDGTSDKKWISLKMAVQEAKLLPQPEGIGGENSQFGFSVSVDGDLALVGGPYMAGSGVVYVLDYDGINWQEVAVLQPADGEQGDQFGISVSLSGSRALVGANRDDDNGSDSGSAYVFDYDGSSWSQNAKLTAGDGAANDRFGTSVSLSVDRVLVGAYLDDDNGSNSGSAYIFDFDGTNWMQSAKLTAGDGAASDQFGYSVSLSGDRALVGAYLDDDNGGNSGSAYVYDYDGVNWSQSAKLMAGDGATSDRFGNSVSLSGDRALVGAYLDDDNGSNSGSVYIYDFDGMNWSQSTKLTAGDGAADDKFGISVSLSGDRALVGAYLDDDNGGNSGSAYIFDFDSSNWSQSTKLTASDGDVDDWLGYSVSLSGDRALVGARLNDDNGSNSGSAYVFDYDAMNWSQSAKLIAGAGAANDSFGWSVSLSGNRALVGAWLDDDNGTDSGSAYIFDFDGMNWSQSTKLTAGDGAADDEFGISVSLSGDRALVGANHDDNNNGSDSGSAYVFDYDGISWSQSAKLTAGDGAASDLFGYSVSLSGDRVLVGAPNHFNNGGLGSTYVFDYDGSSWSQSAKLIAGDGAVDDFFGVSVSLSGDRALVGDRNVDDNGSNSGSAYVYDYDGVNWSRSAKLMAKDGAADDWFGISVSLSGDRALVGAFRDDDNGSDSGSAYVFDYAGNSWSQSAKLTASDGTANDHFGISVSLSGDRVLVGAAYFDAAIGSTSGSAYVFDYDVTNWAQSAKLTAGDGAANDNFGISVSLSDDRALVGAFGDDDNGSNSGSAFIINMAAQYDVNVSVSGLAGGALSVSNGGDGLNLIADGTQVLSTLNDGSFYDVDITDQPTLPNQLCSFDNTDTGTISGSDVTVNISCVIVQYAVQVNLTGLAVTNTVSFSNGVDSLNVSADGAQTISTLDDGSAFDVDITAQPDTPNQVCGFDNADAGILNGADYTVNVTCLTTQYSIGGNVSGLAVGNEVILQNNTGDDLIVTANGAFTFVTQLYDESPYAVTVLTQPTEPNQACTVTSGSGHLAGTDVNTVTVNCVTDVHTVGGLLTGLAAGNSVILSLNSGSEDLVVNSNGTFEFVNTLLDESSYAVTVFSHPTTPNQNCEINNGSGTLMGSDVTDIEVVCTITQYYIGGSLFGLIPDNSVIFQNNADDDLLLINDGAFAFATPLDDETGYEVTILNQPNDPIQPCQVFNAIGNLAGDDVDNVFIYCELGDDLIYRHGFDTIQAITEVLIKSSK